MWRGLGALVLAVLAGYGVVVAMMYYTQDLQVYHPATLIRETPADRGLEYEDVRLTSADGTELGAWFVPAPNSRGTMLYLPGNAGNRSFHLGDVASFTELGVSVFIIDYRSFGDSDGQPSEEGTYQDSLAGWRYLLDERGLDESELVIYGRSLGAAHAAWIAADARPVGVILASPFPSAPEVGANAFPWLPVRTLLRYDYNTLESAPAIRSPTLVLHGRSDRDVPLALGEAVFEAIGAPRTMVVVDGGHNLGFSLENPQFREAVDGFLRQRLGASAD